MQLIEKAKKEAIKNGKSIKPETEKALKQIQHMHDLCSKIKGSPFKIYAKIKEKGK